MAMVILEFAGIHILHWLVSALLPLLLAGLALYYRLVSRRLRLNIIDPADNLAWQIDQLEGRSLENLPAADELFHKISPTSFCEAFDRMSRDSAGLYQNRWLPDPKEYLRADLLLSAAQSSAISLKPAARCLAIGLLGSLISLLIMQPVPPPSPELRPVLMLLPLAAGLAAALLSAADARHSRRQLESRLDELHHALARHLPVFNDQAGVAMLVDSFLVYDRQMKDTLQTFTATAGRLADSDMADGIRRSIEQVLTESVAPPIQQSAAALGRLAGELSDRQENGMQDLASRFAAALSAELAAHMNPVNRELSQMTALMADVKNYIEVALRALETARQQSDSLLQDTRQAMLQTAEARTAMAADYTRMNEQLQMLNQATGQMAELYQGNDQNLAASLQEFGSRLDQNSQKLGELVQEAIRTAELSRQSAASQQTSAGLYLDDMREQVARLSTQLSADLNQLLEQIRQETGSVAANTADIGSRLGQVNSALTASISEFTQSSGHYVQQTLERFDASLAEVVNRLTHAALEIQDAVDALPAALQQGPRYGA